MIGMILSCAGMALAVISILLHVAAVSVEVTETEGTVEFSREATEAPFATLGKVIELDQRRDSFDRQMRALRRIER